MGYATCCLCSVSEIGPQPEVLQRAPASGMKGLGRDNARPRRNLLASTTLE